jgi:hypothetical protein
MHHTFESVTLVLRVQNSSIHAVYPNIQLSYTNTYYTYLLTPFEATYTTLYSLSLSASTSSVNPVVLGRCSVTSSGFLNPLLLVPVLRHTTPMRDSRQAALF